MKSASFANAILEHIFQNADITGIGDAGGLLGSETAGTLTVAAHTANPSAGNQSTSVCNYTGYANVTVARSSAGWDVTNNVASNIEALEFGMREDSGAAQVITHVSVGPGDGSILYICEVTDPESGLSVTENINPTIPAGSATFTEEPDA